MEGHHCLIKTMICTICKKDLEFKITQNGKNKGREYAKCECNKFYWNDSINYNPEKFKNGSCYRCGTWGCEITDCEKSFDWYGNLIPDSNSI